MNPSLTTVVAPFIPPVLVCHTVLVKRPVVEALKHCRDVNWDAVAEDAFRAKLWEIAKSKKGGARHGS